MVTSLSDSSKSKVQVRTGKERTVEAGLNAWFRQAMLSSLQGEKLCSNHAGSAREEYKCM